MGKIPVVAIAIFLGAKGITCAQAQQPSDVAPSSQQDTNTKPETPPATTSTTMSDRQSMPATGTEPLTSSPSGSSQAKRQTKDDSDAFEWSKVWTTVTSGLFTLIGAVSVIVFQRHSLKKSLETQKEALVKTIAAQKDAQDITIKAQNENLEATIEAQLKTAAEKLQADANEKKRSSLVTAIATEAIFLGHRAVHYAEQVSLYEDVTRDDIEHLRIIPNAVLTVAWENAYLLESAAIQMGVKVFTNIIERANRRVADLEWMRNNRQSLPHEECAEALKQLVGIYRQCSSEANTLVDLLKKQFPIYCETLEDGEIQAKQTSRRTGSLVSVRRPGRPAPIGDLVCAYGAERPLRQRQLSNQSQQQTEIQTHPLLHASAPEGSAPATRKSPSRL